MYDISKLSISIIAIINFLSNDYEKNVLINILNVDEDEFNKSINELRDKKYIFIPYENIITFNRNCNFFKIYNISDYLKENNIHIIKLLYYYYNNEYKKFFELSLQIFEDLVERDLNQAFVIADLLTNMFSKVKLDIGNKDICLAYFEKSYQLITLIELFPWRLPKLFLWVMKGESLAFAVGNYEYIGIFNLLKGFLSLYNVTRKPKNFWLDSLNKGISMASRNKSFKLSVISVYYKSFLCYLEGNFFTSINICYSIDENISDKFMIISLRHVYMYGIFSAIAINDYNIAFDICDKAIKFYDNKKIKHIKNIFIVHKAYIHILNGERKISSEILNNTIICCNKNDKSNSFLWILRLKAYIYYLNGDIQTSYRFYKSKLHAKLLKQKLHTGYMCSYFMLNLLSAYYRHGLPNLYPYSIIDEIPTAKQSPSIIVRGVAHRISGQLKLQSSTFNNRDAEHELLEAYTIFKSKNIPQELGICCIELSRIYHHTDRFDKAMQILREADEIYRKYGSPELPDDLLVLLDDTTKNVEESASTEAFIYTSPQMADIEAQVKIMALHNTPVLILGESGVGKENIARQLHKQSGRTGKFVPVNLNSIPDELFESELFGHEKGAYTGATGKKPGLFDLADNGTLFLDEIGDISLRFQVKLLRVLQEHEFLPVGGTTVHTSDFRLICATNRDLQTLMSNGSFREDLYFRINVLTLKIPPLRERGSDILKIANHYLNIYCTMYNIQKKTFSHEIIKFMVSYPWPGNIRELKNYVERYVLTNQATITSTIFSSHKQENNVSSNNILSRKDNIYDTNIKKTPKNLFFNINNNKLKDLTLDQIKMQYVEYAWVHCNGIVDGQDGMAQFLGISKVSVYKYIDRLNLRERYPRKVSINN